MKRLVAIGFAGCVLASLAMPTRSDLAKAQEMVSDVTAADVAALKAGTKKPAEVAVTHLELADKANSEAEKYLLLQGAFHLYAKAGDYDRAAEAVERMQTEISDFNPEVIIELCGKELIRKMKENAPRLYALKENARRIVFYRKQLPVRAKAAKAKPTDALAQKKLGECHAELGDWAKALAAFAKAGGELAKTASAESSGTAKAQVLADFWWDYETKSDTPVYRLHAAEWYRQALTDNTFQGLARERAERRVKEVGGDSVTPVECQKSSALGSRPEGCYCVIDISGGVSARKFPVSYLDEVPKGGWSDEYKTSKIVLRRIEPGRFDGADGEVQISKPYYLGVFELTQRQWELVTGKRPSTFSRDDCYSSRPVETVSYTMVRGANKGLGGTCEVDDGSFLGILRAKSGVSVDLPTVAQWLLVYRAFGAPQRPNCRCGRDSRPKDLHDDAGRFLFDRAKKADLSIGTAAVGSYIPNAIGIYDLFGNVEEMCYDYCKDSRGPSGGGVDSVGESARNGKMTALGGFWIHPGYVREHKARPINEAYSGLGIRLCMASKSAGGCAP